MCQNQIQAAKTRTLIFTEQYKSKKERITEEVIQAFIEKLPESEGKIKKIDVATIISSVSRSSFPKASI